MGHWAVLAILAILTAAAIAQNDSPECPDPWVSFGNNCYYFSKDDPLSWLDAKIYCEKRGALLISVNNDIENQFLNNWFSLNDNVPDARHMWYTSGYTVADTPRENPTFMWLDGSGFGTAVQWRDPEAPKTDTGDYVTYIYDDVGIHQDQPAFFWVRDKGDVPRSYICEISKSNSDKINSKERDFIFGIDDVHPDKVTRGPYFVEQPKDLNFQTSVDTTCTENCPVRTVSFNCEARGYPQPKYEWYEDIISGTRKLSAVGASNHLTITNGRLTINNPSRERDTSTFWCEAFNEFGRIRSEKGRINFITLDEFPRNTKDIGATAFQSANIVCDHPKREGVQYAYKWFMNDRPTDWVNSVYNNHVFISDSGTLYFSSVTNSDQNAYHCTVSIRGGDESRSSPGYNLVITDNPSYQDVGPIIHNDFLKIIPKNPQMGDLVFLECFARYTRRTGEAAVYKWSRPNGLELPAGSQTTDYDRRLIIHNVQPEDMGEYTCTVEADGGSSTNEKSITLSISAKPFFGEGRLENQHLDAGDDFKWVCLASGTPTPQYQWFKNGAPFSSSSLELADQNRITFSDENSNVEFRGLNIERDPGMYQCAASNTHGTTYSSAQMRVLEFGPSFAKHPMLGRVLATEGGNTTIACDPEAAPQATITWLKDGEPTQYPKDSSSPKRILPNDYLFLSGITKNVDEGNYSCIATNTVLDDQGEESRAETTIELLVVQRSRLAFGPVDDEKELGDSVTMECRADFNPILDLVYLWYHNDRLIDFDDWKMAQMYRRGLGVNRGDLVIQSITYEQRGQYKCRVQTKSDYATLSAMLTVYGPPGEPAGIKTDNPGKHKVTLSWSKGAENGAPVKAYIIERYNVDSKEWVTAKNVSDPAEIATTNATVEGLFANTGYKFRIRGQNEFGVGVASVESEIVQTLADRPTTYPNNIRGGGGKEGTLVIQWDPLPKEQWNAEEVQYVAEYKLKAGTGSYSQCTEFPIAHGDTKSGRCVVTIGTETFYTPYHVRVWAKNQVGDGPIPDPVTAMSAVKVPVLTPQNIVVQPLNATALTAYWDPVPNDRSVTGGELTGFHVQYWKADTRQEYGRRNTIIGNVTEGTIIGLEPNTDYMVTAQLFNSAGDAPSGSEIPQTTWFNAPLNMPEYVTLNRTYDRTVGVHFKGVVTGPDEEPLDGYKVRIWRQGENIHTAKDYDCGRRTSIMISDNFEPDVTYNLRVFGYSRGGVGKMSSPLTKFILGCNRRVAQTDTEDQWVFLCNAACKHTNISYILAILLATVHLVKHVLV